MFNVSALLLDDALKPATPLTNGAISETLWHMLDISQGSVATHLRCGIFSDSIITNFFPDSEFWQWNNYENWLIFGKVKAYKNGANFWATLYISTVLNY